MFLFSAISHIYCVVVGAWQHSWLNANNLFEYLLISCAVQHSNFHVLPTTCYATHPSWYTVYVCLAFICFDCVRKFISENLFVLWSIVQCIFMFFLNGRIKKNVVDLCMKRRQNTVVLCMYMVDIKLPETYWPIKYSDKISVIIIMTSIR